MIWFVALVLSVVSLYWIRWRIKNKQLLHISDQLPGPPTIPILGNALQIVGPPEELTNTVGRYLQEYGDLFRVWIGPDLNIFVNDPDDIKTLLKSHKTSIKGPQYKYIRDYCGSGLLSGSGPSWRICRKTVLPNYGKKALEAYDEVINDEANETVRRLMAKSGGKTFDIYDDIVLGTTYTVCRTLMGLTREQTIALPNLNTKFLHDVHDVYLIVFMRMTQWYLQVDPFYWMTKYYQTQKEMIKKITEIANTNVKHRLKILESMDESMIKEILNAEGDNKHNTELSVIDRLLLSNQLPSHEELVKQWFTLFTASQEATAKITSYALLMMAYHPECQEKVYAEIKEVFEDNIRDVTEDDLKLMPYLDMVFKEVIRLFPIGVMLQRTIAEDIEISNATLPAGCSLVIPIYHLHRDKRYWTNPNAFEPERFSPENSTLRHPNCYIPFSLGPMDCMGRYFAIKLVKTICIKVLQKFRLTSPESYEDMRLVMAVSVASVNGYPVQVHPRN
ncbi:cytochrome P450 4g15-like [Cydia fagiglandana]|uniref:cytochrome P450 4g15-like n=1 Tax=Cydia fagiglandana TaxID=1458189 RepID=UPI002FEE631F